MIIISNDDTNTKEAQPNIIPHVNNTLTEAIINKRMRLKVESIFILIVSYSKSKGTRKDNFFSKDGN